MHDTASSFRYKTVYRFEFAKNILKKTGDFFLNLIASLWERSQLMILFLHDLSTSLTAKELMFFKGATWKSGTVNINH